MSISRVLAKSGAAIRQSLTRPYANTSDDWYDKAIEQYKGTSYYDTLASNPHLVRNAAPFSPSAGDKFAEFFGDFSAGDRYYADLHNRAAGYLNEQIEKMRQEGYNDASSQAAQMRAAGLNPDLQNVQPGQAAENDQPFEPAEMPEAIHPQQILSDIAQFTMNAYSFASGFAQDMLSFRKMSSDIESTDIDNGSKVLPLVADFFRSSVSRPVKDDDGSWRFPELSLDKLDSFSREFFQSRSARNRFKKAVSSAYGSAKHQFITAGAITDEETAITQMSDALGVNLSRGYDGKASSQHDPVIMVSKQLADMRLKLEKIDLSDKYSTASYHKKLVDNLDPVAAAQAQNSTNELARDSAESKKKKIAIDNIVNETMLSIIKGLQSASLEPGINGILAKGLLVYYSCFGVSLPTLPSFNIGGTTNVTSVKTQ